MKDLTKKQDCLDLLVEARESICTKPLTPQKFSAAKALVFKVLLRCPEDVVATCNSILLEIEHREKFFGEVC